MSQHQPANNPKWSNENGMREVASYLRANYDILVELVEAMGDGSEFSYADVPDHFQANVKRWKREGIIIPVRTDGGTSEAGAPARNVWAVSENVVGWVKSHSPRSPKVPCGHHGFKNRGDSFECPHNWCDERFSSMQLSRALNAE